MYITECDKATERLMPLLLITSALIRTNLKIIQRQKRMRLRWSWIK